MINQMEILDREWARARREARPLAVMLGDLDHFKRINDTRGHLAGDAVLREVAKRMNASIRPYDFVGRFGGEEFLIVLPGCDRENMLHVGERLRECIASAAVPHDDQAIPVTVSLGGVVFAPPSDVAVATVMHAADTALYRAKDNGRNRIEVGTVGADAVS
jgi:two-component system, cell cycle response regulator